MKLSKKLASIGLAVAMVASIGATSVFASYDSNYEYTDYGMMFCNNTVKTDSSSKTCTVTTSVPQNASKVCVDLIVVNYPSGQTLYSNGNYRTNTNNTSLAHTLNSTSAITTYGAHQVFGSTSWGEYTSCVNA